MIRKKNVERESYWRDVVRRQAASGMSIRQFCAKEGVSQPSFYAWRRRLRDRVGAGKKPRRRRTESGSNSDRPFIPVTLLESCALEIIHPLGCGVRVVGAVDIDGLKQVLDVLDGRGTT